MPALVFSFARLARFGPCEEPVFLIPAVALAVLQRLLKASPPPAPALPALVAGLLAPNEGVEVRPGFGAPPVLLAAAFWAWTEV